MDIWLEQLFEPTKQLEKGDGDKMEPFNISSNTLNIWFCTIKDMSNLAIKKSLSTLRKGIPSNLSYMFLGWGWTNYFPLQLSSKLFLYVEEVEPLLTTIFKLVINVWCQMNFENEK
jgi:hypothetical protein